MRSIGITLPDVKYLISILAPGFKIGGQHFTMPIDAADPLLVQLTAEPLQLGASCASRSSKTR